MAKKKPRKSGPIKGFVINGIFLHILLQLILKHLLELLQFRPDDEVAIRLVGVVGVVILVVVLRRVEVLVGLDGGDDGFGENVVFVELIFVVLGAFLLGVVMVEDDAAVLGTLVVALAVQSGGVVGLPENLEQFVEGDLGRVVDDLAGFGVTGRTRGYLLIGGVHDVPPAVAGSHLEHAVQLLEDGLGTPEATRAKGGRIGFEGSAGRELIIHGFVGIFLLCA